MTKQTENEILKTLDKNICSDSYNKFNFGNNVLTSGIVELVKLCGCNWLLTDIDAYFLTNYKNINNLDNTFWIATIKTQNNKSVVTIKEDTNIKPIITQKYDYSTFPLKEFEFYIIKQGDYWVYLLKSEY